MKSTFKLMLVVLFLVISTGVFSQTTSEYPDLINANKSDGISIRPDIDAGEIAIFITLKDDVKSLKADVEIDDIGIVNPLEHTSYPAGPFDSAGQIKGLLFEPFPNLPNTFMARVPMGTFTTWSPRRMAIPAKWRRSK